MAKQKCDAIVVFPDAMFNGVYTEFADSANMGPWGMAFTRELVAAIAARYRIGKSYVAGFSSGGWAALWLQTTYPQIFSGGWAFAPDPLSFRDFTGPDLTKLPPQNFYGSGKTDYRFIRVGGEDRQTLREFVQGSSRGFGFGPPQFRSFNAVFSPAEEHGPQELFDLKTGDINPSVAEYWETNYDIANRVVHYSPDEREQLVKKLHVVVGTWDTYHLDGPSKLFCYALYNLNLQPDCTLVDEADHGGILRFDGDYENHVLRGVSH
jgi:pimeloyl-ACP methyl ester carboxylesterase